MVWLKAQRLSEAAGKQSVRGYGDGDRYYPVGGVTTLLVARALRGSRLVAGCQSMRSCSSRRHGHGHGERRALRASQTDAAGPRGPDHFIYTADEEDGLVSSWEMTWRRLNLVRLREALGGRAWLKQQKM